MELELPLSFHILTDRNYAFAAKQRGPKMNGFLAIMRGCQGITTSAVLADWLFISYITPLVPGDEDYALSFVVPVAAPGVRIHPRRPYAQGATPEMLVPGTVMRAEAVCPDRELRRTEYFADWLRPQGIGVGGFAILGSASAWAVCM